MSLDLLDRIERLYQEACLRHCEAYMEIGRLGRVYVQGAIGAGRTYWQALGDVAARISPHRARRYSYPSSPKSLAARLIYAAAALDLLVGPGASPGRATWSAVREFNKFVVCDTATGRFYAVKEAAPEAARLLARAVAGLAPLREVRREATALRAKYAPAFGGRGRRKPESYEKSAPGLPQIRALAREANPKDLADLIVDLIGSNPDPQAVQKALQAAFLKGVPQTASQPQSLSWTD